MGDWTRAPSVRVSRKAARALRAGHPWWFREGGSPVPPGTPVVYEADDRPVAWGLSDAGTVAGRVLGRGPPPDTTIARVLAERVRRADAVRVRLVAPGTDAYRVVASAGDGLPDLVVDRYGPLAVVRLYAKAWEPHLPALTAALVGLPWVEHVWRKLGVERVDGRDGGEALHGGPPPDALVVHEADMALLVRPFVGQKTGLFLDQREHRALVRRFAGGRNVANLFAYNGGFSVAAALGGAARVVTVDLAPDAVDDAREVFRLNGLDPDDHGFEVADAFQWTPRGRPDLLVVDPPALTRGKRSDAAARTAYRKLHARLGPFVPRDGLMGTSSCTARMNLVQWKEAVAEGLRGTGDWSWHWVSGEPPDHPVSVGHPEGHYLKFGLVRRIG